MKRLDSRIVALLAEKLKISKGHIRNIITRMSNHYPQTTPNGVAHIFALERGVSIRQKLDKEDKASLPQVDIIKQSTKILKLKIKNKAKEEVLVAYSSDNLFINGHIDEINKTYNAGCYTAVFILTRKVIENLIIDILKAKFPTKDDSKNLELYYDKQRGRYKDFSIILDNLRQKKIFFGPESKAVEQLYNKTVPLKNDANDKAHSWFHLVRNKKEIEDLEVDAIITLIRTIEKSIGIS